MTFFRIPEDSNPGQLHTREEMIEANRHDPVVVEWFLSARPGDVYDEWHSLRIEAVERES